MLRRKGIRGGLIAAVVLGLLLSFAPRAAGTVEAAEPANLVNLYRFDRALAWMWNQNGYRDDALFLVITTQQQEARLLKSLSGEARQAVQRAIRATGADYEQDAVVLTYLGEQPSQGHFVKIRRVDGIGSKLTVQFSSRSPAEGEAVARQVSYPVDAVRIDRAQVPGQEWTVWFYDQNGRVATFTTKLSAAAATAQTEPADRAEKRVVVRYTLRTGDTLWGLANRFGTTVNRLLRLNPGLEAENLWAGQAIRVEMPVAPKPVKTYTVRTGDSLWSIAQRFETTVEKLIRLNGIEDASRIEIGQRLILKG